MGDGSSPTAVPPEKASSSGESDSDAPKEESIEAFRAQAQKKERDRRQAERADAHKRKQQRRHRDAWLKENAQKRRRPLSEVLAEVVEEEVEQAAPKIVRPARPIKLSAVKDGFVLKVAERRDKRLAPAASTLLAQRRAFLVRESVRRR